jgi:hypothetical protein
MNKLILAASEKPIDPDVGIYEDVPFEEYQQWNCFSKSMVSSALKSGQHLQNFVNNGKKSKALGFGTLVDTLVLEPHLLGELFVIQPATYSTTKTTGRAPNKKTETITKPWNLNSKTCKEIQQKILESGKSIVKQEDLDRAKAIQHALFSCEEAAVSITAGKKQVSMVWVDPETGVKCKGRIDILTNGTIDDLKTSIDASPDAFSRAIGKFFYFVQAGAYTEAYELLTGETRDFRFIVAETSGETEIPEVALYDLDHESIIAGRLMFKRALRNVKHWLEHGVKGYSKFWEPVSAPRWMVNMEIDMSDEEIEF